ncbi:MAG TPA: S41 family peptidase [Prolixibacteraceae bacterium]|nr:S41 family peptidase [Prolixibacteraceae bacterium]
MNKKIQTRIKLLVTALIFISILLLLLSSCSSLFPNPEKELTANEYIYETFKEWYLWYDEIPEIKPNDYDDYTSLIAAIKSDVDRWSFAGSYTEINNLFFKSESKGFGSGFKVDYDQQIKITKVYRESPMGKLGVERGWVINSINGFTIDDLDKVNEALASTEAVDFVFTDYNNQKHQHSIQKESFVMNTVLYSEVIEIEDQRIGYLVFDSFTETSVPEIESAIALFNSKNITNLIVDLRYNGGGLNSTAHMLMSVIGGEKVKGQIVSIIKNNNKKSKQDVSVIADYDGATLDIDKVYFITTSATASASELVINNISPYIDIVQVGSTTHGKPVGMYIISFKEIDLSVVPISFINTNSLGFGEYFDGIPANIIEVDDLNHRFGDPEEAMLKAAINDILHPLIAVASPLKSMLIKQQKAFEYQGINQFINAW